MIFLSIRGEPQALLHELRRARVTLPAYRSSPVLLAALGEPDATPRTFALNITGEIIAMAMGIRTDLQLAALGEAARSATVR